MSGTATAKREPYSEVWGCPFCAEDIAVVDSLFYDAAAIERALREHLRARHPIRRRLSRKYRRAFRQSEAAFTASGKGGGSE